MALPSYLKQPIPIMPSAITLGCVVIIRDWSYSLTLTRTGIQYGTNNNGSTDREFIVVGVDCTLPASYGDKTPCTYRTCNTIILSPEGEYRFIHSDNLKRVK